MSSQNDVRMSDFEGTSTQEESTVETKKKGKLHRAADYTAQAGIDAGHKALDGVEYVKDNPRDTVAVVGLVAAIGLTLYLIYHGMWGYAILWSLCIPLAWVLYIGGAKGLAGSLMAWFEAKKKGLQEATDRAVKEAANVVENS